ncbi:MAG: hypothetical protein ACK4GG_11125 [Sphingomonas sp.]
MESTAAVEAISYPLSACGERVARGAAPEKEARWRKSVLVSGGLVMLIGLYYSNFAR